MSASDARELHVHARRIASFDAITSMQ